MKRINNEYDYGLIASKHLQAMLLLQQQKKKKNIFIDKSTV